MASGGFSTFLVIFLINVLLTGCTTAVGLGETCSATEMCDVPSLVCVNKVCQCAKDYVEQTPGKCSAMIGTTCQQKEECVLYSECDTTSNTCKCSTKYHEINKLCFKNLGEECTAPTECNTAAHEECLNKQCSCSSGYSAEGGKCKGLIGTTCQQKEECVVNSECDQTCKCSTGYQEINKFCFKKLGEVCTQTTDCNTAAHEECLNKQCSCSSGFFAESGKCKGLVGTPCKANTDCINHAECATNEKQCKCSDTYQQHGNNFCTKNIGDACTETDNSTCGLPWMTCVADHCACATGYVKDTNSACRGVEETPCQITEECVIDAVCNGINCNCKNQYRMDKDKCILAYDTPCKADMDCGGTEQSCQKDKCGCAEQFHFNNRTTLCEYNLHSTCTTDNDCGKPTLKCASGTCECNDGFRNEGVQCLYKFDNACDKDMDCGSVAMKCSKEKKCECNEKYYFAENLCKAGLHSKCYGRDCNSTFAECKGENSTCQCTETYKENDVYCMAPPTKPCNVESGCSDEHSSCNATTLVCDCAPDFQLNSEKTKCSGSSFSASFILAALALVLSRLW